MDRRCLSIACENKHNLSYAAYFDIRQDEIIWQLLLPALQRQTNTSAGTAAGIKLPDEYAARLVCPLLKKYKVFYARFTVVKVLDRKSVCELLVFLVGLAASGWVYFRCAKPFAGFVFGVFLLYFSDIVVIGLSTSLHYRFIFPTEYLAVVAVLGLAGLFVRDCSAGQAMTPR